MDSPYLYCRQLCNGEESHINKIANFQVLDFSNLNNFSDIFLFGFLQNSSVFAELSSRKHCCSSLQAMGDLSNYLFHWDKHPILALLRV